MLRNTTLGTDKSSLFDIFSHTRSTFSCWRFIIFGGRNKDQVVILQFSVKPARWVTFGALFFGVGVGVLLEHCDSSDDGDGGDTASDVSDFL